MRFHVGLCQENLEISEGNFFFFFFASLRSQNATGQKTPAVIEPGLLHLPQAPVSVDTLFGEVYQISDGY